MNYLSLISFEIARVVKRTTSSYQFDKTADKLNNLISIDNPKLNGFNKREIDVNTVEVLTKNIG